MDIEIGIPFLRNWIRKQHWTQFRYKSQIRYFAIQKYHKSTSKYLNIYTIFGSICSHSTVAASACAKGVRGLRIDQKPVGLRLLRHVFPCAARRRVQRRRQQNEKLKCRSQFHPRPRSPASDSVSVAVAISVAVSVLVNVFDLPFCTCWPSHVHRVTNPHTHPPARIHPEPTRPEQRPASLALHRPLHLAAIGVLLSLAFDPLCLGHQSNCQHRALKDDFHVFPPQQQLPSTPGPIPFRLNGVMLLTMPNDARRNLVVLTAFTDILMVRLLRFWMKWFSRCCITSSLLLCPIPNIVTSRRNWIEVFDWQSTNPLTSHVCSWINCLATIEVIEI